MSYIKRVNFFSRWAAFRPIASLALVTVVLFAGNVTPALSKEYPEIIEGLVKKGMKIEKSFPVVSGMTGWVVSQNGRYIILYTTKDEKTLIAGGLYDNNGNDITEGHKDKYVPKPDWSGAYKELKNASYVKEGRTKKPKNVIYVFFDPNCPYCHKAWRSLQPYEQAGLQVRWIPVAYLSPSSLSKAMKIIGASNRTDAFRKGMTNFARDRSAAADLTAKDDPKVAGLLQKNSLLMSKFRLTGTPAFVWKNGKDEVQVMPGMPKPTQLPLITGITLAK